MLLLQTRRLHLQGPLVLPIPIMPLLSGAAQAVQTAKARHEAHPAEHETRLPPHRLHSSCCAVPSAVACALCAFLPRLHLDLHYRERHRPY